MPAIRLDNLNESLPIESFENLFKSFGAKKVGFSGGVTSRVNSKLIYMKLSEYNLVAIL